MSRNPILNDKAFGEDTTTTGAPTPAQEWANASNTTAMGADAAFTQAAPAGVGVTTGRVMTLGGVAASTLLMFAFLLAGAWFGWTKVSETVLGIDRATGEVVRSANIDSPVLLFGALIIGFGLAIVTAFKPKVARFTSIPYAVAQGVMLGMISHLYNVETEGIVAQAILATFGVFLAMLVLYGLRILRATPKFVKGVIAATFGIMFLYLGTFIFSLITGNSVSFMVDSSPLSIGISVIIVIVAALNLILDFDFIERGAQNRLPAYMDWYAAFGLMVTLIWLYLEMLRLLSKIRN